VSKLKIELQNRLKESMKAKDNSTRDNIRSITSAIKQVEVDTRKELTDVDILKIITKMVKQREDAICQFIDGDRKDLAEKEQKEVDFLKQYLPKQLEDKELETAISEIISQSKVTDIKEMGKVMGVATQSLGSTADGKRISQMVRKLLSK
jgi:uncharacterized protein YqeY